MSNIDIDSFIDYEREYKSVVQKWKEDGPKRLVGLCPFHDDHNASMSVDLKTGKFHCFSCGEQGNFITFESKRCGISTTEAFKNILERYGIEGMERTYTVNDYALEKRLPEDWLKEKFKLSEGKEKDGSPFIKIPYFDGNGKQVLFRKRYMPTASKRFAWKYGSQGKLIMYGEWWLKRVKEVEKYAVIVEGESDTQSLVHMGIPALGVPGASTFKPEWCVKLIGINRLYLHIEPDAGGKAFFQQMASKLLEGKYQGEVYKFSCAGADVKDPSDLLIRFGKEQGKSKIETLIEKAESVDLKKVAEIIPAYIKDAPLHLRTPDGWVYSDDGIRLIDSEKHIDKIICRTPIIITRRLRSLDTGDEKIELAFKRDGEWKTTIQSRSLVFQTRSIPVLADLGITVTSENAKYIVSFLSALESANLDIIGKAEAASTFGWQGAGRFIPGHADGIELDVDASLKNWASAYCKEGTFEGWKTMIAPHRERDIFRFILAASFTAPLLKIVKQRIFFVYNWANSKSGKTSALKAAMSVWGDPERLMVSFNATQVALERIAGFFCDLPMGIDERQLAGDNQGSLEKIVYMLASGAGRARGAKNGGLQTYRTWRTVVLATGEEPIAQDNSQTGVATRILELYGAPFENEQSAGLMHREVVKNYGWAGEAFIDRLIVTGNEAVNERYEKMLNAVLASADGHNASHAAGIAAVATADSYVSEWIFGDDYETAMKRALVMANVIIYTNDESASVDVNAQAAGFVSDWINSNSQAFTGNSYVRYGEIENGFAYVYPAILKKALSDAGYSHKKTLKYMLEKGICEKSKDNGYVSATITKRCQGKVVRYIAIDMAKLSGNCNENGKKEHDGFTQLDDDVPF